MRIENHSGAPVAYELRGGPHRMTLSECDLEPGESDEWDTPYRHTIECVVIVRIGDEEIESPAGQDALVQVVKGDDGYVLKVQG